MIRFRDGLAFCVGVFLAIRIGLSLLAVMTVGNIEPPSSAGSGVEVPAMPGWHNAFDGMDRWDAGWFERIATSGYDEHDASAAFFPGYPLAIRDVSSVTGIGAVGSALLVSNLAFLGSMIVLFALTAREFSEQMARRTVLLLSLFPASFFFFAPYSESLFLLLSLLAFWWARAQRPWLAAGAALLAAGTRSIGVLLMPALLMEAWTRPVRSRRQASIASLTPLLAPMLYGFYWFTRTHDPFQPLHAQDSWYRALAVPLVTLGNAVWLGVSGITDPRGIYWTADLVLTVALLIPLGLRWRLIPPPYLVYVVATVLLILSYPLPERPLLSDPRFLIVAFPVFWAMADLVRGLRLPIVLVVSTIGYAALCTAFMNWGFVF